jgi:hypothetical protein
LRDGGGPVTVAVTPLPGTGIWLVRSPGASRQPLNRIGLLSHKNDSTAAAEPCAAFSLAAGRVSDKHQSARASRCGGLLSASPTCISAFGAAASVGARLNYPRRPPCRREPCFPQRWSPGGLRFPRPSTLIRPASLSLRSARRFASGWMPQSCSMRLETLKVSAFRSPLMCQSASPASKAFTPRRLARHSQETSMGPAMNLPWIGETRRPRRMPQCNLLDAPGSRRRQRGSQLASVLVLGDIKRIPDVYAFRYDNIRIQCNVHGQAAARS